MSTSMYYNDPVDDLPFCEDIEPHLAKGGDIIQYRGWMWKVKEAFYMYQIPHAYCNKHKACYSLIRYDMGIIEVQAYITNADFGDDINQASVYVPNSIEQSIIEKTERILYSKAYYAVLGKDKNDF